MRTQFPQTEDRVVQHFWLFPSRSTTAKKHKLHEMNPKNGIPIPRRNNAESCSVTYIWLAANDLSMGGDLRALTRVLRAIPSTVEEVPLASCNGAWTGQADPEFSTLWLIPRSMFVDPFQGPPNLCVLCDPCEAAGPSGAVEPILRPHSSNNRTPCEAVMRTAIAAGLAPTFVVQQEYTLLDADSKRPIGEYPVLCRVGEQCWNHFSRSSSV